MIVTLLLAQVAMAKDDARGFEGPPLVTSEKERRICGVFDPDRGRCVGFNHDVLGDG